MLASLTLAVGLLLVRAVRAWTAASAGEGRRAASAVVLEPALVGIGEVPPLVRSSDGVVVDAPGRAPPTTNFNANGLVRRRRLTPLLPGLRLG
jgi:hypothetical protein